MSQVPFGCKVALFGSDSPQIIDLTGKIMSPLKDTVVQLLFKVYEEADPQQYEISKNVSVIVPGVLAHQADANGKP
ncbi:hypothetical protein M6D81_19680 [Paenibacillus sp. J5C_2022]|uniref:hypothetical protein n=1 Tax=Paenibacillus sp. J5C2022 TaxID=2977129 RepID=UPI0021D2D3BC|nr:hypothetical protein [Paenibacillus sp. J5C2022]MCU6710920.1 hypothetical protein [Paenibacillus sp. J5C2022]